MFAGQQRLPQNFDNFFPENDASRMSKFVDILAPFSGETVRATGVQLTKPGCAANAV